MNEPNEMSLRDEVPAVDETARQGETQKMRPEEGYRRDPSKIYYMPFNAVSNKFAAAIGNDPSERHDHLVHEHELHDAWDSRLRSVKFSGSRAQITRLRPLSKQRSRLGLNAWTTSMRLWRARS
jgi:hypothetical protein